MLAVGEFNWGSSKFSKKNALFVVGVKTKRILFPYSILLQIPIWIFSVANRVKVYFLIRLNFLNITSMKLNKTMYVSMPRWAQDWTSLYV